MAEGECASRGWGAEHGGVEESASLRGERGRGTQRDAAERSTPLLWSARRALQNPKSRATNVRGVVCPAGRLRRLRLRIYCAGYKLPIKLTFFE